MRIGNKKLKMSDGSIRTFRNRGARERFEHYVNALKHGWKPDKR